MSLARQTTGTLVKRNGVTISELATVSPPKFRRNKLETSTHNDGRESNQLGMIRQDDGSFRINFVEDDATHNQIFDDFLANTAATWSFILPSGVAYTGQGRVQKWEPTDAGTDAIQQVDCGITWSGPVDMS